MHSGSRGSGHGEGSSSRSPRLPRSSKQGPRKLGGATGSASKTGVEAGTVVGSRSGLAPGSVSGLAPGSGSGSRAGPSSGSGTVSGTGSGNGSRSRTGTWSGPGERPGSGSKSGSTDAGGKTMSMENVQSLSAAYTSSGPVYLSDRDGLGSSGGYPKGTMTLGRNTTRNTSRTSYADRTTAMGSSPNITSTSLGPANSPDAYGEQQHTQHLQTGGPSGLLRQAGREGLSLDLQDQLRELQRENELLRRGREVRDGRMGSSINSVNFWSPEVKRERGMRKEEGGRTSILKDQYRTNPDETQHLLLSVAELQEELRAHREQNSRLQQEASSSHRDLQVDPHQQECRGGFSPVHSPRHSPAGLGTSHSPSPGSRQSPRQSPSNTYNSRHHQADIQTTSPGYGISVPGQSHSPASTLVAGPRGSSSHLYSPGHPGPSSSPAHPRSPCQVPGCDGSSSPPPKDLTEENFSHLQSEHERQAKELSLLRRTMEEMELRIDSQKQTLGARDESIQRLLEMLQGGRGQRPGVVSMATEELGHLEEENLHLREELHRRNQLQADPTKTKALQTVIDMKTTAPPFCFDPDVIWQDTKISSLERNIRDLEDEVQMLKTGGLLHPDDRHEELKHVELYKSHSKFMKTKIDQQKQELNKKESDMQALQTKLETLTNQNSDCKQHIDVLKESLNAKEQRSSTLQTEESRVVK
ncbi:ERC protein 2-like [Osmerus eperlanus]|uniref:ERC protein 2-like n=1 Tax=Osmerus eperlanus TaxID=29151 RepID=UPI002E0DE4D9